MKLDCSIIVLSFNTKNITDICLTKAEAAAEYSQKNLGNKVKIIVVDNGSVDGSVQMVKEKHKKARLIALGQNTGYAKGNNVGMRLAKTPFILLINSDLYLTKTTIVQALKFMEKNNCDVLSCKVVNDKGGFEVYGGHLPTPFKTLRWILGIESIPFLKQFMSRIYQYNPSFYTKAGKMEWCPTCFFLIRRKVYQQTGGFDENLFLYMEDVEWCQRLKEKGFEIWHTPGFQVLHKGGASQNKLTDKDQLQHQVNGLKYFHKVHYPKSSVVIYKFLSFGLKIRAIIYLLSGNLSKAKAYYSLES